MHLHFEDAPYKKKPDCRFSKKKLRRYVRVFFLSFCAKISMSAFLNFYELCRGGNSRKFSAVL